MASPVPAKSQPLHNFSLPHHLIWNKTHSPSSSSDQHHQRSRTRLSTPPPPPPPPSSSSNPRRPSPYFDPHHVSRRHSPLLEFEPEIDFRRQRSPVSSSRRQTLPAYVSRKHSPLVDPTISKQTHMRVSDLESDFTSSSAAAAADRSDLSILPSDQTKLTQTDYPQFVPPNEKRKRSKICVRIKNNDQEKSAVAAEEGTSAEAAAGAEEEESVPKTWNLRPRRPINKQSNVNGNGIDHKLGGSLYKEIRSVLNNEVLGINGKEKQEKEKKEEYSISVSLSRREIEEDLYALTGSKPSRRPKKRSKTVQRQIETVLPGMWLGTINVDMYKVSEAPSKV